LSGRVYLVGAGPGDPLLLTARALALIAQADVILYDRLIPEQSLDGARAQAETVFVGKEGAGASVAQEQTEALMIERALAGKSVVRLKGGDPFVFGRGGEEALALRRAGIPYEIVPGITAGIAAPAYAGVPVTHRGLASAVALVTGHEDPGKEDGIDWQGLASFPGTLVFYMGVRRLEEICESLLSAGRDPSEPALVVQEGTLGSQRSVSATLQTIAARSREAAIRAPAVAVVGAVAGLAEQLAWLPQRALAGRTVAVTRAREQASPLAGRLGQLGASVVQAPTIRIRALPGPPLDPAPYDLVCVTSANGVDALFERLAAGGRDARSLAGARVAVIGRATAEALARRGILADVVPERAVAEALVDALSAVPARRALVACASGARDVLPQALRGRGIEVELLELYETVAEPLAPHVLERALQADYITFTSASTVRFFIQAADGHAQLSPATRVVSIGPITSAALLEHGLRVDVEARHHDVDGMVDALLADAAGARQAPQAQ
jgi:uroporphyrinogen III methyltransferase/synthase